MHIFSICEKVFEEDPIEYVKRVSAVNIKEVLCCASALTKGHKLSFL